MCFQSQPFPQTLIPFPMIRENLTLKPNSDWRTNQPHVGLLSTLYLTLFANWYRGPTTWHRWHSDTYWLLESTGTPHSKDFNNVMFARRSTCIIIHGYPKGISKANHGRLKTKTWSFSSFLYISAMKA